MSGDATKYGDIETMLRTAALSMGRKWRIYFRIGKETPYIGAGRKGAENFVHCNVIWRSKLMEYVLSFMVFFCKTEGGGYIISDVSFDFETLVKYEHPGAKRMLFRIAEDGDVSLSDYPLVMDAHEYTPTPEGAEERLLKAIFGENYLEEMRKTEKE